MKDIIVTTPKHNMELAAQEAAECLIAGGGYYFRTFRTKPLELGIGSKIFYAEDGYVRGYGVVSKIVNGTMECDTSGTDWGYGWHAIMSANSWTWIHPIAMNGFRGYRYFDSRNVVCIGTWRDPKPKV